MYHLRILVLLPGARASGHIAVARRRPAVLVLLHGGREQHHQQQNADWARAIAAGKLDLCRGAVFEDNADQVQTYTAGQVVAMTAILPIPHEGPMNVSIIDTATNTAIGAPLIEFASYADEKLATLPANNTAFSVTMPQLAAGQCAQGGQCVMQWFWFGTNAKQTYESCVDFVMA